MSVVYAHMGADDQVLYIGVTQYLERRTEQHRRDASWWPQVESVELASAGLSDYKAKDLERRLVETFDPPHNFVFTARWRAECRPDWARPVDAPVDWDSYFSLIDKGFMPDSAMRNARRLDATPIHARTGLSQRSRKAS